MKKLIFSLWNLHILFESLPISSTSHLALLQQLPYFKEGASLTRAQLHLMHLPTNVIIIFFLLLRGRSFFQSALFVPSTWFISATIVTLLTCGAYLFKNSVAEHVPRYVGLFITGCLLISLSYLPYGTTQIVSSSHAAFIGLAQAASLLPGISRLASTVCCGIFLGIDPIITVLFSLTCEAVIIFFAIINGLRELNDKRFFTLTMTQFVILIGTSLLSYSILGAVTNAFIHKTIFPFGWYLITLAVLLSYRNSTYYFSGEKNEES